MPWGRLSKDGGLSPLHFAIIRIHSPEVPRNADSDATIARATSGE